MVEENDIVRVRGWWRDGDLSGGLFTSEEGKHHLEDSHWPT
tara:strand:- start:2071 stop:2193 length:123 start_codon:yes stop_codon:yes gene_type:complete